MVGGGLEQQVLAGAYLPVTLLSLRHAAFMTGAYLPATALVGASSYPSGMKKRIVRCGKCGGEGHNRRTCSEGEPSASEPPKKSASKSRKKAKGEPKEGEVKGKARKKPKDSKNFGTKKIEPISFLETVDSLRALRKKHVRKGLFNLILVDPPWKYKRVGEQGKAQDQYYCMTVEEIAALPVDSLAAENCVLIMWYTGPKTPEAIKVIESWGFQFKTGQLFNWRKTYKSGKLYVGMGFYSRSCYEPVALAIKGSAPRAKGATSVSAELEGPVGAHSEKPESIYEKIEELWPHMERRLELFSRKKRKGWVSWGAEVS